LRKLLLPLVILALWVGGCGVFTDSFESVSGLDRDGKCAQAIQAYQEYLKSHPHTVLKPRIYYRIARNYEALSDYTDAIHWYEKVSSDCPQTDEARRLLTATWTTCN
jgi:tetratricopeptide (TPR) repeat protein